MDSIRADDKLEDADGAVFPFRQQKKNKYADQQQGSRPS
jgi:hypothetical protein